jgi:SAM-dependent MidA family methyltransferase
MPKEESFAAFMQRALFDPQGGYYSRKIAAVGGRGDFSTSATLSPVLGKAVARWLTDQSRNQPEVRTVIEIGGGDGSLMQSVRKELGWWRRRRLAFCMVETSAILKEQQRVRLGASVQWFDSMESALDSCSGAALIYHNEFLDALPITLVQWNADSRSWKEVWLAHQADGRIKEELRPMVLEPVGAGQFSALNAWNAESPPPSPRQRCELHTGIRDWLSAWSPHWKTGSMLAIDYGDTFPALYHRRPNGTLRAYLLHQRLEGQAVYENAGRQDITSDINFTDLQNWCTRPGWSVPGIETQAAFIKRCLGGGSDMQGDAERFLLASEGAGSAFKCLTVRRQ